MKSNPKNNMWKSVESKKLQEYGEIENKNEFTANIQDAIENGITKSEFNRKSFLTVMGASMAMAGVNCVKEPVEKIVPYLVRPPEAQPGIPVYYATARVNDQGVLPMLVKTREGKPIKIDGHDDHPVTSGAMTADGFATIWDLYDPDRVKKSLKKNGNDLVEIATVDAIMEAAKLVKEAKNIRVLSYGSFSPSERKAATAFLRKAGAKKVTYDSTGVIQDIIKGEERSFGRGIVPQYRYDKADFILSIEADFLGTWLSPETNTKLFSKKRNPDSKMSKLVVAEAMMSLTGANADQRLSIKAGTHTAFALGLVYLLLPGSKYAGNGTIKQLVNEFTPENVEKITGVKSDTLKLVSEELGKHKGSSLVIAGGVSAQSGRSGDMQVLANLLNSMMGNDGNTIISSVPVKDENDLSSQSELVNLISEMKAGSVDLLIIDQANPVFDLPEASGFAEALKGVKNIVVIANHLDETASQASLVVASNHFLESWNDGYSSGVYTIAQPVIRPLFDTISSGEFWLKLSGSESTFYDFIRSETAPTYLTGSFNSTWEKAVKNGFFVSRSGSGSSRSFNVNALSAIKVASYSKATLNLYESVQMRDGRGSNISFRHELPDPITKITWDNYVAVSPADARENSWRMGDILELTSNSKSITAPVFIQPGLQKGSYAIAIGYGHTRFGQVSDNVGVNARKLVQFNADGLIASGIEVDVKKVDDGYTLATTQRHPSMEGRGIARYASQEEYKKNPKAGVEEFDEHLEGVGLYPIHPYSELSDNNDNYKWGLNIDLSKCTGCSACVLSCYSENNVATTGKHNVSVGKEMSWLRIDRYYEGEVENPGTFFVPVMCQHCENAPCENVCPVNATSHSYEGLNDIAYNRCVGTRYCLNNCPFKVRRFNWYENWEGKLKDPQQFALNPDVTVRTRGVIEKCSMCVHRINEQRQQAKIEGRKIDEEDLKTACQQGCPADAITFGDLGNKKTTVYKNRHSERSYRLLDEINVRARVSYLSKIINNG